MLPSCCETYGLIQQKCVSSVQQCSIFQASNSRGRGQVGLGEMIWDIVRGRKATRLIGLLCHLARACREHTRPITVQRMSMK